MRPVSAVDLFSGAGGFSLGLCSAGLRVVGASDNWTPAVATYRHNHRDHLFIEEDARLLTGSDLRSLPGASDGDLVVVGGPPCQGFSSAGARQVRDERNSLVAVFSRLAVDAEADAVVFENVEGFLTADGGSFIVDLLDPLHEANYHVSLAKVNVANFGVPQLRKRVIAVASRRTVPRLPAPTHQAFGAPGVERRDLDHLPLCPTFDEGVAGLGATDGFPSLHVTKRPSDIVAARIAALKPGQTMRDLPAHLQHASYQRRANRRVADGTEAHRRGGAPAGLRRLRPDKPSKAVTGAASREFVHPYQNRTLTLRECARLQSFPDNFEFLGAQSQVATMIGNAVPPHFGAVMGAAALETLEGETSSDATLRVDVGPNGATSPSLVAVLQRLQRRYGAQLHLGN